MQLQPFLEEHPYVDFMNPIVSEKARQLFAQAKNDVEKARIAYLYVRDEIPHSFDIQAQTITARASDVLRYQTGICHAKANLLAALLRSQHIPVGFCFQHLTLADDDTLGYCVHGYNAIYLEYHWIKVDARGNTNGKNAQFSLGEPQLAFPNRKEYDEYFWPGIYAKPHMATMEMLDAATCLQDVMENFPDAVKEPPDIFA